MPLSVNVTCYWRVSREREREEGGVSKDTGGVKVTRRAGYCRVTTLGQSGRAGVGGCSLRVHCSVHVQFTSSAATLNILVFTCVQFMFSSCSVQSKRK